LAVSTSAAILATLAVLRQLPQLTREDCLAMKHDGFVKREALTEKL